MQPEPPPLPPDPQPPPLPPPLPTGHIGAPYPPEHVAPEEPLEPGSSKDAYAVASMVIGFFGTAAWCLPLCGFPVSIVGIALGIFGLKSQKRVLAMIGLGLNILCLLLTLANGALGVYMALKGQGFSGH